MVMDAVGREARGRLATAVLQAWVDQIDDAELEGIYAQAVGGLEGDDVALLAAWHASLEVGTPQASRDFLIQTFPALGEYRREAVRLAMGFHGDRDLASPVGREALARVLPQLVGEQADSLAAKALGIYVEDRLGSLN